MKQEFDQYIDDYRSNCDKSLRLSGESVSSNFDLTVVSAGRMMIGRASTRNSARLPRRAMDHTAFLIDAARAGQSFHWEGCPNEKRWPYDLDFTKDAV